MQHYQIAASLLAADFSRLGEEAKAVIDAGVNLLHLDVMDNHFVPNLTVGPLVCEALRRCGIQIEINVHLMVMPVDRLIVDFAKAGATSITFHPSASTNVAQSIALIHQQGCKAGIAISPELTVDFLPDILDKIDTILVMSVHPGFGGQDFIPSSLEKIRRVRNLISASNYDISLGVDGGIKISNIGEIAQAGADIFVAGTAIFCQPNYREVISDMRTQLASVK
jgi:ribulose-phosphate 3-epimerase